MSDLDADIVQSLLDQENGGVRLVLVDEVDSTNSRLMMLAREGVPSGYCLVARHQTAGRGRQGRRWRSDRTGSLTFSLLWRFNHRTARELAGIPLAVSLSLLQALEEHLGITDLALKWPNDLLRQGRKIAGTLVEIADTLPQPAAVIGIGLNVSLREDVSDSISNPAFDLRDSSGGFPSRNLVLAAILKKLPLMLNQFDRQGFAPFRDAWLARSIHLNRSIRLSLPNHRIEIGECAGLTDEGALLLRQGEHLTPYHTGDVSLRLT